MKKLLQEPLVHFLLFGTLLFGSNAWREEMGADTKSPASIEVTPAYEYGYGFPHLLLTIPSN